jgi:hypothetical protein
MTIRDFTADDVEKLVNKSVELKTSFGVGARGGLDLNLHASDYFDFNLNAALSSVGTAFSGPRVLYLGGGVTWRWDDIVPAVLPAEKRLLHESCDDVEARFKSCPNSSQWRRMDDPAYGPLPIKPGATTLPSSSSTPPAMPASDPVAPPKASPPSAPTPPPSDTAPPGTNAVPAPAGSDPNGAFPAQ